jgi:hypothetical protein
MKTNVLSLLKPKTASLGFTNEELEGVAENIARTLKEGATNEQINQAIDSALPFLQMSQKAVTRIVNAKEEKSKKEREEAEAKRKAEEEEAAKKAKGSSGTDEEPAWFKSYREQQDAKFAALESEKLATKRIADFEDIIKNLSEKQKISETTSFKRLVSTFKDDEDFNSYLEEKKISIGEIEQENANVGLGNVSKPGGGGRGVGDKPASAEECDAIVEKLF